MSSKVVATELIAQGHKVVLEDAIYSENVDLRDTETLLITKLPDFKEPWVDPNEPVFNSKKHRETCDKKRKARKKKKRR